MIERIGHADRLSKLIVGDVRGMGQGIRHGEQVAFRRIIRKPRDLVQRVGDLRHPVEIRFVLKERRVLLGIQDGVHVPSQIIRVLRQTIERVTHFHDVVRHIVASQACLLAESIGGAYIKASAVEPMDRLVPPGIGHCGLGHEEAVDDVVELPDPAIDLRLFRHGPFGAELDILVGQVLNPARISNTRDAVLDIVVIARDAAFRVRHGGQARKGSSRIRADLVRVPDGPTDGVSDLGDESPVVRKGEGPASRLPDLLDFPALCERP